LAAQRWPADRKRISAQRMTTIAHVPLDAY
jgi:hypothetical protein